MGRTAKVRGCSSRTGCGRGCSSKAGCRATEKGREADQIQDPVGKCR